MRNQFARILALSGVAAVGLFGAVQAGMAQTVSSDQTAGLVVFPRIVSDPGDTFNVGYATETVVQVTNTDPVDAHVVHCFYVNATGRCSTGSNVPGTAAAECRTAADCTGVRPTCDQQWTPNNFNVLLSPHQTLGWVVSTGGSVGTGGDGGAPNVNQDYFEGELKCIEVDDDAIGTSDTNPIAANDIQGTATIYHVSEGDSLDVASYNGIGIQSVGENDAEGDKVLCLGGNGISGNACQNAEYAACPSRLVLDHWFDGAPYAAGSNVETEVTFAPCSEDFTNLTTPTVTVQVLVFNEFEQRFSASTKVDCLTTIGLSDISNIYSFAVQGTMTGQSSFRPVASGVAGQGVGLIGVAIESIARDGRPTSSTAFALNQVGSQSNAADVVQYIVP